MPDRNLWITMVQSVVRVLIHLLGCLLFLSLPYLFASDGLDKLAQLTSNAHERRNLLSYALTIAFFYPNYYYFIPRLFFRRQYWLYGLAVAGCFLLIQTTLTAINQRQNEPVYPSSQRPFSPDFPPQEAPDAYPPQAGPYGFPPPYGPAPRNGSQRGGMEPPGMHAEVIQTFFLFLAGLLLSLAIRINNRWRETEQERIQTELLYLKAQINPHFLFNTLNSIYSLAIMQSPTTADAVVQLSSLLRYVITEAQQERVGLGQELNYISQYVALQRLRIVDTVVVNYSAPAADNGPQPPVKIAPLLLISFIENAFKYGVSPQEPSRIDIRIELAAGGRLHCHVSNQKVRVADPSAVGSGIGLSNTRSRLKLLYPGRHELVIRDQPDTFVVELDLLLA